MEALAFLVIASALVVWITIVALARKRSVPPPVDGRLRGDLTAKGHGRA